MPSGGGATLPRLSIYRNSLSFVVLFSCFVSTTVGGTETGELTAIMGPSGAGKTTFIESISLRNRQWEGGLQFDDKAISGNYYTSSGNYRACNVVVVLVVGFSWQWAKTQDGFCCHPHRRLFPLCFAISSGAPAGAALWLYEGEGALVLPCRDAYEPQIHH